MHRELSFWTALIAIVIFALGTLPTFHGVGCWIFGTIAVLATRYISKWEEHHRRKK